MKQIIKPHRWFSYQLSPLTN